MLSGLDLSLEFLMGRALDNAMLNVEQKDNAASEYQSPTAMDRF